MDDVIYRQAAIDGLNKKRIETMEKGKDVNLIWECLDVVAQVPSAQPDLQPTCNQLATDCISRQAALNIRFSDAINDDGVLYVPLRDFTNGLKALPSAQSEIIRCKDCKYRDTTNYHYCPLVDATRKDDFYCADAERRDEQDG